uniref:SCAPER_N domain-containing protein n=1 Tax=Steinernema glaseri TaxID=37863 RepID=A0A1I8AS49_9BILA
MPLASVDQSAVISSSCDEVPVFRNRSMMPKSKGGRRRKSKIEGSTRRVYLKSCQDSWYNRKFEDIFAALSRTDVPVEFRILWEDSDFRSLYECAREIKEVERGWKNKTMPLSEADARSKKLRLQLCGGKGGKKRQSDRSVAALNNGKGGHEQRKKQNDRAIDNRIRYAIKVAKSGLIKKYCSIMFSLLSNRDALTISQKTFLTSVGENVLLKTLKRFYSI